MNRRNTILSLGVVACLSLAGGNAYAQKEKKKEPTQTAITETSQTTPQTTPQETASAVAVKNSKVICKSVKMEGTRLRKRKVCKTKALWDAEREAMNADLDASRRAVYTGS